MDLPFQETQVLLTVTAGPGREGAAHTGGEGTPDWTRGDGLAAHPEATSGQNKGSDERVPVLRANRPSWAGREGLVRVWGLSRLTDGNDLEG